MVSIGSRVLLHCRQAPTDSGLLAVHKREGLRMTRSPLVIRENSENLELLTVRQ
jgi:hypothetical protein